MDWMTWYNGLAKPSWTPSPPTIGLIWQILYPIIIVTFGFVFVQAFRGKVAWVVALPFAINLVANLVFTPIEFRMRNLPLASVDIVICMSTWGRLKSTSNSHLPERKTDRVRFRPQRSPANRSLRVSLVSLGSPMIAIPFPSNWFSRLLQRLSPGSQHFL